VSLPFRFFLLHPLSDGFSEGTPFNLNYWTFAHELGHAFDCSHGGGWDYMVAGQRMTTVMAYHSEKPPEFPMVGQKVPYFSNPNVLDRGVPTGSSTSNNARTLDAMAPTVANYKDSVPAAPVPTHFQASEGKGSLLCTWDAVPDPVFYRVYAAEYLDEIPKAISDWQTGTSFETTSIPRDTVLYFMVKAAKSMSGTLPSEFSNHDMGWRVLQSPGNVEATRGTSTDQVMVFWDAVEEARSYRVYRSEKKDGQKGLLVDWKPTSYFQTQTRLLYTDSNVEPQQNYYYWIQARDARSDSTPSQYSEPASGWVEIANPAIEASDGIFENYIKISWQPAVGASYYKIYRADSASGEGVSVSEWQQETVFHDQTALPGKTYYYKISSANNLHGFQGTAKSAPESGWRKIQKIGTVYAGDGTTTKGIPLSWDALQSHVFYRVYRWTTQVNYSNPVSEWIAQTEFMDSTAVPGLTYWYFVTAASDTQGFRMSELGSSNDGWRALDTPKNVSASDGTFTDRVRVTWDAVPGAHYYKVFMKDRAKGPIQELSDWIGKTVFDDFDVPSSANRYYLIQAAIDSSGSRASESSTANGGFIGLSPPQNVTATKGTEANKVVLRWDLLDGIHYYQVYRAMSDDGEKVAITDWERQLSYLEDSNVRAGDIWYYWIKAARNAYGADASVFSDPVAGYRYLSPPSGVRASDGTYKDKIVVTWNAVPEATHYRVYRQNGPTGSADDTKIIVSSWLTDTSFTDTDIPVSGHTYYYTVKAAGSSAGAGSSSYSSANGGFSMLPAPEKVLASNGTMSDRIRVAWAKHPEASYFKVYRTESVKGTKVALNELERINFFDDTTAEPGKMYYYFVQASRGSTGYGLTEISEPDIGWISPPRPLQPHASEGDFDDKILITWTSQAVGLYHQLLRKEGAMGELIPVTGWQVETEFEDFGVLPNIGYFYQLKAANNSQGDGASDVSGANGGWRKMPPPQNIKASQGDRVNEILVTWEKVEGANFYQVYRASEPGGERMAVSDWLYQSNQFVDLTATQGERYRYWSLASKWGSGSNPSSFSDFGTGWLKPLAPVNNHASDGEFGDKIEITWESTLSDLFFRVYRSPDTIGERIPISDWQTDTSFNDTGLQPGEIMFYWIKSSLFNQDVGSSDFSDPDTGWVAIQVPAIPANPSPANLVANIPVSTLLDWGDSERADRYHVRFWESGESPSNPSDPDTLYESESPAYPYLYALEDSRALFPDNLKPNTTYFWQVIAMNKGGFSSGPIWQFVTQDDAVPSPTATPTIYVTPTPVMSTPTPVLSTPTEAPIPLMGCVQASQYYDSPVQDLDIITMSVVEISGSFLPDGSPVPLQIIPSSDTPAGLDIEIPYNPLATNPSHILFSPMVCNALAPKNVELVMKHTDPVLITAYDDMVTIVDTQNRSGLASGEIDRVILSSPSGIRHITIENGSVVLASVCWSCVEVYPSPTATHQPTQTPTFKPTFTPTFTPEPVQIMNWRDY
jgi:fibronectin type 3 domain-containing protein